MKPLARILGICVAVGCSLLALAVCVTSFWWQYHYLSRGWNGRTEIYAGRCILHVARDHTSKFFGEWERENGFSRTGPGWFTRDKAIGFQFQSFNGDFKGVIDFYVPLIVPALLLTGATLRIWRGGHARGHCRKCGYNLYGITGGRCPECGTVPSEKVLAQAAPDVERRRFPAAVRIAAAWLMIVVGGTTIGAYVWTLHERKEMRYSLKTPPGAIEVANKYLRVRNRDATGLVPHALPFEGGWDVHYGDPDAPDSFYVHVDGEGKVTEPTQNPRNTSLFSMMSSSFTFRSVPRYTRAPEQMPLVISPEEQDRLITRAKNSFRYERIDPESLNPRIFLDGLHLSVALEDSANVWMSKIVTFDDHRVPKDTTTSDLNRYISSGALGPVFGQRNVDEAFGFVP
jgi:hypothetical protein